LPENRGKPYAMNVAIAEARGEWIAVLDADDCFADGRLAPLLAAAARYGVEMVADNQYFVDAGAGQVVGTGAGQIVGTAFSCDRPDTPLTRRDFIAGSDPFADFNLGMLKPVIRADFIRRTGLRYRESARLGEDLLYLVEFFAASGRGFLVSLPLYYWTQAFGSRSRRWTGTGAGPWRYDFLAARAANAEVRAALSATTDGDLIALLERRDRAFRRLHWWGELSRLRNEGASPRQLASFTLSHPAIWFLLPRRAWRALARRMTPIRTSHARVDGAVT
jgi:succinoglycan biosynthesis protein ExoO